MPAPAEPRSLAVAALLALAAVACSEEDRRAWVSILPISSDEESGPAVEGFGLTPDSTAVLLDGDTLFTIDRVPARVSGVEVGSRRLAAVALSPDSGRVAFRLAGPEPVVGVWTRARQTASLVPGPEGGAVDRLEWAPGGRFLAWQGGTADGRAQVTGYDAAIGRTVRHPVLSWLARQEQSVWIQDWADENRLRVLVGQGVAVEGGLAHLWDLGTGSFLYETHLEPLAERAPPGSALVPGGVFSLDLLDDPGPESVALYRSQTGAPGALLLRSRGAEYRGTPSEPLVPLEALGVRAWKEIERGATLHEIVDLGGSPIVLLDLPFGAAGGARAIGFFQALPDGRLSILPVDAPEGERPAVFFEGRALEGTVELGVLDLDGDGAREVVTAVGSRDPARPEVGVEWQVATYRWAAGRLAPAPELESAARAAIERLTAE